VKSPIVLMSTPRYLSHAGRAIQTSPSGNPEENDCSTTAPIRQDPAAARRLAIALGRFRASVIESGVRECDYPCGVLTIAQNTRSVAFGSFPSIRTIDAICPR